MKNGGIRRERSLDWEYGVPRHFLLQQITNDTIMRTFSTVLTDQFYKLVSFIFANNLTWLSAMGESSSSYGNNKQIKSRKATFIRINVYDCLLDRYTNINIIILKYYYYTSSETKICWTWFLSVIWTLILITQLCNWIKSWSGDIFPHLILQNQSSLYKKYCYFDATNIRACKQLSTEHC